MTINIGRSEESRWAMEGVDRMMVDAFCVDNQRVMTRCVAFADMGWGVPADRERDGRATNVKRTGKCDKNIIK